MHEFLGRLRCTHHIPGPSICLVAHVRLVPWEQVSDCASQLVWPLLDVVALPPVSSVRERWTLSLHRLRSTSQTKSNQPPALKNACLTNFSKPDQLSLTNFGL